MGIEIKITGDTMEDVVAQCAAIAGDTPAGGQDIKNMSVNDVLAYIRKELGDRYVVDVKPKKETKAEAKPKKEAKAEAEAEAEPEPEEKPEPKKEAKADVPDLTDTLAKLQTLYTEGDDTVREKVMALREKYGVKKFSEIGEDKAYELANDVAEIEG